ncbi:MAG: hypothetical protein HFE46_03145 [Clostridia bacterium]|nr:hypothetical protein [Clostridia bacterium]
MKNLSKNIVFGLSGGWVLLLYFTATAIVYALTVVGAKKAYALLKCASFCVTPFGKNAYIDYGSHKVGNTFWAVTAGWQAALASLLFAAVWYATVVGAYLGSRYLHLAQYAVAPFGAKCYPNALLTGEETAVPRLREEHNFEL